MPAPQNDVVPCSLEAERSVLGAILIENAAYQVASALLEPADFFRLAHRQAYEAIGDCIRRDGAVDFLTLAEELERSQLLDDVGGRAYIGSLTDGVPRATNVAYYARVVREHATLRRVIEETRRATGRAYAQESAAEVSADLRAALDALNLGPSESAEARLNWLVDEESRKERARREARRRVDLAELGGSDPPVFQRLDVLLQTDIPPVEYVIDRLQPKGSKVLFAAQAKAGKTTTVVNLIRSLVDGVPFLGQFSIQAPPGNVCLIDLEMSASQLPRWFKDGGIRNTDRVRVVQLRGRARDFNLLDPNTLTRWAAELKREEIGYLIFDNLRPLLDSCGLDENRDAGRFLVLFDRLIAEAGVSASMIVHHMGHNGDRSRGDSRLRDWPDVEWKLTRQRGATGEVEDPNSPRFFSCYGRDVHHAESQLEFDPFQRHLTIVGGNRREAVLDEAVIKVYDVLEGHQMSQRGVEDACKTAGVAIGRDTIREALTHGARSGAFVHSKGPRNSDLYAQGPHPPLRGTARGLRGRTALECADTYRVSRTSAVEIEPISARMPTEADSHVEL